MNLEVGERTGGRPEVRCGAPRPRGSFAYAWRVAVLLLLVAGLLQVVSRQFALRSKRDEIRQRIIAAGGSYWTSPGGQLRVELPANRISRDEIRQIYRVFPTAEISLRRN